MISPTVRRLLGGLARLLLVGGPLLGALLAVLMGMSSGASGVTSGLVMFLMMAFWGVVLGGALTLLVSIDLRLEQLSGRRPSLGSD